jgi:alkylation response protein AidB-like acyl-CoA dehydrogenase
VDREERFPHEGVAALQERGLMRLAQSEETGGRNAGLGGDMGLLYRSIFEIAKACPSSALVFGHHQYVTETLRSLGSADAQRAIFAGNGTTPILASAAATGAARWTAASASAR